jgi:hypothetical protein
MRKRFAMADLKSNVAAFAAAQPFNDLASELKLPLSTLQLLRARGQGPKTFRLGRRIYVSPSAKADWIATLERVADNDDPEAA